MKSVNAILSVLLLCTVCVSAHTQRRPPTGIGSGGGSNLIKVTFSKTWDYQLDSPAKLIEIGPVTDPKKNSLVAMLGGKDATDNSRKLVIMHWDGLRFSSDATLDFKGLPIDALLIGKFRSAKTAPVISSPFDRQNNRLGSRPGGYGNTPQTPTTPGTLTPAVKTGPPLPPYQLVTTEGVYAWINKGLTRLYGAPVDIRLTLVGDQTDDRLVAGQPDKAVAYEVGENYVRESTDGAPTNGGGYVRMGVGTQEYAGSSLVMLSKDIRYVQTLWEGRNKQWIVGLVKGSPAPTTEFPNATTGDRLVVYVPRFSTQKKSFWQYAFNDIATDFEEDWRSDPLPGRVVDIRIGDPRNEGKIGILVLTSENKEKEGHLYFYQPDK